MRTFAWFTGALRPVQWLPLALISAAKDDPSGLYYRLTDATPVGH